jgi:hypothetical protein
MGTQAQPELDFDFYLPAGREQFRVWEVATIIRHSRKHVEALASAGEFGPMVDARHPRASKSSMVITRAGLVAWLKKRKR